MIKLLASLFVLLVSVLGQPAAAQTQVQFPIGGVHAYSTEANKLFAAQAAAGWTPPIWWRNAADNCITCLKSSGAWTAADIITVPIAGTLAASEINWKTPGIFNLTANFTDRPIFTAYRGIGSDGTSSNFNWPYIPSVNGVKWTQNDASMWSYISAATPGTTAVDIMGSTTAPLASLEVRNTTNVVRAVINDANGTTSNAANFTATGSGTNLTASAVASGTITTGTVAVIAGTGIPASTHVLSQTSGTPGGIGVYVTDNVTTAVAAASTQTAIITTGSGLTGTERVSFTTKRFWNVGTQLGIDSARNSTAVASGLMYLLGSGAASYNGSQQLQFALVGNFSSINGHEAAFTTCVNALIAAIVPAAEGGLFTGFGDSGVSGAGVPLNTALGQLLNYSTGRQYTPLAAGGTTLAQQATVIIAHPTAYANASLWWDYASNGHVDFATDKALVDSTIAAGLIPSKTVFLTSVVLGPPNPGVTDVLLADMQTLYAYVVSLGFKTFDVQSYLNGISPAGPSKTAGLVDVSLTQGGSNIHLNAATMDLVVGQTSPLLNQINFVLKRDIDPATNDNSPMWLEQAA